jgi:hypothetical protein
VLYFLFDFYKGKKYKGKIYKAKVKQKMENKILKLTIQGKDLLIQMLKMDGSLYLNIGEQELSFKSLLFAIPTKFDPVPNLRTIKPPKDSWPDWHEELIQNFTKSLSKKLNIPIYTSIDLNFKEELDGMGVMNGVKEILIKTLKTQ